MTRREVLASAVATPALRGQPRRRPNLLFVIADDHAGYALGADGNRLARTPNLERLASEGTRFARHYCNSPVCTPSRQSLLTGQLPHTAGVTRLPTALSSEKPSIAKQLKQAGYATAVFGKMHFNRPAAAGLHGFDVMMTEAELTCDWMKTVQPKAIPAEIAVKPKWRPFQDPARIWLNADKLPYPRFEAEMRAAHQLRRAEEFLEAYREKPFAMWVSFLEPHSPYDFPVEDRDRYRPEQFQPYRVGPDDADQIPLIFRDLSDRDKSGINAAYYTSVQYVDRNVGRVLDLLRRYRLEEDTLVIYLADHGYNLGQHGRFEKHCGFDPALRVPFIVRFPGRVRRGVVNDLTEHVDVSATILDLLGADPLPVRHGVSLRGYLEGRAVDRRERIFSEYLENEEAYIRSDRWKFIHCSGRRERGDGYKTANPTPGRYVRLFDLHADSGEFANVASKHPDVAAELQEQMLRTFRETHPEAAREPQRLSRAEALDWYLRPRDA